VHNEYTKIIIETIDTDVVVLSIAAAAQLQNIELWVAFSPAGHFRYIATHEIAAHLGPEKAKRLFLCSMRSRDATQFRRLEIMAN
jgi:hypothetical protein